MQKYGAAPSLTSRASIVGEDDDDVIKMITPPQRFMRGRIGQVHGAIVIPVTDSVAPTLKPRQRPRRKSGLQRQEAVGTIYNP